MQSEPEKRPEQSDLEAVLRGEVAASLTEFLADVHPADLADWIGEVEAADLVRVIVALGTEARAELLRFAEDPLRARVLRYLDVPQIAQIVEELPADEAVDLLALTEEGTEEQVLRVVDFERSQGLRKLLRYGAETAGGLMSSDYLTVSDSVNVGDAIKGIRSEEGPATEDVGMFVVDEEGRPVGFVSDRDLLTTPIHTPVREVMETDLITVATDADQEEVAQLVHKYSFSAVPVVDKDGVLIGVVSAEDAQEVLAEETEEDILRLVGTSPREHQTYLPVLARVRHRLPLQALTVLGGLVTAAILGYFLGGESGTTSDVLRYLPIIIGLAGNVGIQSSTILVRAFATGEVSQDRELSVLSSEVLVGFLIGTICGITTMVVAGVLEGGTPQAFLLGNAIGLAITTSVTWAAFLGCVVPMFCQRFGIDPAIVAGPFLITLSDISGAAIYVGTFVVLGVGV